MSTLRDRLRSMYAARQRDIATEDGRQIYTVRATDERLRDLITAAARIAYLQGVLEIIASCDDLSEAREAATDALIAMGEGNV